MSKQRPVPSILTLWTEAKLNEREGSFLRKPSRFLPLPLGQEDKEDIETLIEAFLKKNDALGLAAPQIGINKRVVVFRIRGLDNKNWSRAPEDYEVLINPRIVQARGELVVDTEGCLSCPEVQVEVPRFPEIKVKACDREGRKINRRYEHFLARIVQHELDHLDGKLIVDSGGAIYYPKKYETLFKDLFPDD